VLRAEEGARLCCRQISVLLVYLAVAVDDCNCQLSFSAVISGLCKEDLLIISHDEIAAGPEQN
jgi:hypothetical protein